MFLRCNRVDGGIPDISLIYVSFIHEEIRITQGEGRTLF